MTKAKIQLVEEMDGEAMKGDILVDKEFSIIAKYNGLEKMPTKNWKPCHMNVVIDDIVIASTSRKLDLPRPSSGFVKKYLEKQGVITEVSIETDEENNVKISNNNTITIRPVK